MSSDCIGHLVVIQTEVFCEFQDLPNLEAMTAAQLEAVIDGAAPVDSHLIPQHVRSHAPPRSQEQLTIRPGERVAYSNRMSKICTEEKSKSSILYKTYPLNFHSISLNQPTLNLGWISNDHHTIILRLKSTAPLLILIRQHFLPAGERGSFCHRCSSYTTTTESLY